METNYGDNVFLIRMGEILWLVSHNFFVSSFSFLSIFLPLWLEVEEGEGKREEGGGGVSF